MNNQIIPAKSAAQQAAWAAVTLYRAGFHQEAQAVWLAAVNAWRLAQ